MAKWPNGSTTGVPVGVTLSPSGGITITQPGVTVSGLHITGPVYILASDVTLQNCAISNDEFSTVHIGRGLTGVVVKNCDIDGQNSGSNGILGQGTFLNNNIYNIENGIAVAGDDTLIEGNYIHDFGGLPSSHYDGVEIDGGTSNTVIRGNTIINDLGQTSAVMIDNYFGPVSNVLVHGNLLAGGGFTIYVDGQFNDYPITNVKITGNHIGKGYYGDLYLNDTQPEYRDSSMDGWALVENLDKQTGGGEDPEPPPPPPPPPLPTPPHGEPTGGSDYVGGDGLDNVIRALSGNDRIYGADGNDTLYGDGGNDSLIGGRGDDKLVGGPGRDFLRGGSGDDTFVFRAVGDSRATASNRDVITDFTEGHDKIDLGSIDANTKVAGAQHFVLLGADGASFTGAASQLIWQTDAANKRTLIHGDVNGDRVRDFSIELIGTKHLSDRDFIGVTGHTPPQAKPPVPASAVTGTNGIDHLAGDNRNNTMYGRDGNDWMTGGGGNDTMIGGKGRDVMSGGGGHDIFKFATAGEIGSMPDTRDIIADFVRGQDKIDLSSVDANTRAGGDQAFTFLPGDNQRFHHKAGELAWRTEGDHTIVQSDCNGDGVHDFEIQLTGRINFAAADFIL